VFVPDVWAEHDVFEAEELEPKLVQLDVSSNLDTKAAQHGMFLSSLDCKNVDQFITFLSKSILD
jgi:hypothetical protein